MWSEAKAMREDAALVVLAAGLAAISLAGRAPNCIALFIAELSQTNDLLGMPIHYRPTSAGAAERKKCCQRIHIPQPGDRCAASIGRVE
jgi:hypothetical protein